MLKHYAKVAIRSLSRQKAITLINIAGLSTGIACFILFLLYCVNELSFDRFHKNEKDIYRVYEWTTAVDGSTNGSLSLPMPLGPALQKDLPGIVNYVRIKQPGEESFVRTGNDVHRLSISYADPQFFSVFSFPIKYGNVRTALQGINNLVLTESKARTIFGTGDVVGRVVEVKTDNGFTPFTISAVTEDIPANSSISFDAMGSFVFLQSTNYGKMFDNWYTTAFRTYVQLRSGSQLPQNALLQNFYKTYNPGDESQKDKKQPSATYGLQPLRAIHTDTKLSDSRSVETVAPKTIWIIMGIAAGILFIACINFTTLAIGRSAGRSKEIGVRKIVGAQKKQLVFQFIAEAFLISAISTGAGLLLANILLPYFNQLAGRELHFSFAQYPEMIWLLAGILVFTGLVSGSYPAVVLSGFKTLEILKNKLRISGSNLFTKSLVTFQFGLSICFIVATIILLQQINYMKNRNPGFNKENVIAIDAAQTEVQKIYPLFKQALQSRTDIAGIAAAGAGLGEGTDFNKHGFKYYGKQKNVYEYAVDSGYIPVMGMQLTAGRNFTNRTDDTVVSVVINETMMKDFGWTLNNAVGQLLKGYTNKTTPVVIGVVKNFNFRSLKDDVQPLLFYQYQGRRARKLFVRIKPGNPAHVLAFMKTTWSQIAPDVPFKYSFVDEDLDNFYKGEQKWGNIVGWAGGISIFLACLGLFGLAALAVINRTKEMCIRKILGASYSTVISLLSKDFLQLIGIAFLIATPVTWYFMNDWLQDYAYRINIALWVFAVAGIAVAVIALTIISFQALKVVTANPVDSLRTE
jgi:putative ABC transport system permease protein